MNVGLVGAGLQGHRRALALREAGDDRLVLVADVDADAAGRLAREHGAAVAPCWEDVVSSPLVQAVLICTPPHLHAAIGMAAAEHGKHVLCEKPLARDVEEAREFVAAVRRHGVLLRCGLNLRHHPGIRQAREWVASGAIGELMNLSCRYGSGGRRGYDQEWRARPEISGGGELMDQGQHVLDLFRWFAGEFTEAFAMLSTSYWPIVPVEDNAFGLLRTARGQVASLHVSWTEWTNRFAFEVFGRDGYVRVEGLGGSYGMERATLGRRDFDAPFREEVVQYRGPDRSWAAEWAEFSAAIRDGVPIGNGEDALAVHRLVSALVESGRTGRIAAVGEQP